MLPDADDEENGETLADFDLSAESEVLGDPLARLDTDALLDTADENDTGGVELTVAELRLESVAATVADEESENTLLDGVADARDEIVAIEAEGVAECAGLTEASSDSLAETDGDADDVDRAEGEFEADAAPLVVSLGHADGLLDAAPVADELRDAVEDADATVALELGVAKSLVDSKALALTLEDFTGVAEDGGDAVAATVALDEPDEAGDPEPVGLGIDDIETRDDNVMPAVVDGVDEPKLLGVRLALCRDDALDDPLVHLETLDEMVPVGAAVEETDAEEASLAVTVTLTTADTEVEPLGVSDIPLDPDDDGERDSRALRDALADARADGESCRDALPEPELLTQRVAADETELLVDRDDAAEKEEATEGDRETDRVTVPETEELEVFSLVTELFEVTLGHWLADAEGVKEADMDDDAVWLSVALSHAEIDGVRDALSDADAQPLDAGDDDTEPLVVLEARGDHDEDLVGIDGSAVPLKQTEIVGDAVSVSEAKPDGESAREVDGTVENDIELDGDVDGDSEALGRALRDELTLPVAERVPGALSESSGVAEALGLVDVDDVSDGLGVSERDESSDFVIDEDPADDRDAAPDFDGDEDVVTDGVFPFDGEKPEDGLPLVERCPVDDALGLKERNPLADGLDETLAKDDTDGLPVLVRDDEAERELCRDCVARAESENFSDIEAAPVEEAVVEGVTEEERVELAEGEVATVEESSAVAETDSE